MYANAVCGKKKKLTALENTYQSHESAFIPIYGRRRVGKSELIKHFIKDKKALYFLGKQAPARLQLKEFLMNAAFALQQPLLEQATVNSWHKAISLVIEQVPAEEKIVLVTDEFQWTVEACPELPSVLQSFIDNGWSGGCKVFLILCGSYMGFMEKKVLGKKSLSKIEVIISSVWNLSHPAATGIGSLLTTALWRIKEQAPPPLPQKMALRP